MNEFIGVPEPVIPALTDTPWVLIVVGLAGGRLDRRLVRGIGQVQGHCRADADLILYPRRCRWRSSWRSWCWWRSSVSAPPVDVMVETAGNRGIGLAVGDVDGDGRRHADLAVGGAGRGGGGSAARVAGADGGIASLSLLAKFRCAAFWLSTLLPFVSLPSFLPSSLFPPVALAVALAALVPEALAINDTAPPAVMLLAVVAVVWSVAIVDGDRGADRRGRAGRGAAGSARGRAGVRRRRRQDDPACVCRRCCPLQPWSCCSRSKSPRPGSTAAARRRRPGLRLVVVIVSFDVALKDSAPAPVTDTLLAKAARAVLLTRFSPSEAPTPTEEPLAPSVVDGIADTVELLSSSAVNDTAPVPPDVIVTVAPGLADAVL